MALIEDIKTITRDDLFAHYRRYYAPNNAVLAIAGDFDTAENDRKGKSILRPDFGIGLTPQAVAQEPASRQRRSGNCGPGDTTYLRMTYRAPGGNDPG